MAYVFIANLKTLFLAKSKSFENTNPENFSKSVIEIFLTLGVSAMLCGVTLSTIFSIISTVDFISSTILASPSS